MTFKQKIILIFNLSFLTTLSGCEKTITLSQEVLLNTGEKIIATWIVDYNLQGDAGNPLNIKMRPKLIKTLVFNYHEKKYRYHGDATLFLLAISPEGRPNLVLHPNGFDGIGKTITDAPRLITRNLPPMRRERIGHFRPI